MNTTVNQWRTLPAVPADDVVRTTGVIRRDLYNARNRGLLTTANSAYYSRLSLTGSDAIVVAAASIVQTLTGLTFAGALRAVQAVVATVGLDTAVAIVDQHEPRTQATA